MKTNQSVKYMLSQILKKPYYEISSMPISDKLNNNLSNLAKKGIPPQYITASIDFYDREFLVAPGVFIPRPETEILVELILERKNNKLGLEIGVGCGAISIVLLSLLPQLRMVGTEVSLPAVEICMHNLINSGLNNRMGIVMTSKLDVFPDRIFDFIISNPPYIPTKQLDKLPKRVRFEPNIALDGGESGVEMISWIVKGASRLLKKGGILGLEIDPSIMNALKNLLIGFRNVKFYQDYSGKDRFIIIEK